jgi:hypothetical protein
MTFERALTAIKHGQKVCRSGWNGKGMWIVMVEAYGVPGIDLPFLPWLGLRTAQGEFVPWLASQTDILAEDWEVAQSHAE